MVMADLPKKAGEKGTDLEKLDSRLVRELHEALEEGEPDRPDATVTSPWYYQVPAPGVRYYSYTPRPGPLAGRRGRKTTAPTA